MNHGGGVAFTALPRVVSMSDHDRSDRRPIDRFYLVAIVGYAVLAAAFIGYFVWWMMR